MLPLTAVETSPSVTCYMGCGPNRRPHAVTAMLSTATKINVLSKELEKYSSLSCPKTCSASGGLGGKRQRSVTSAATKFTKDSSASESNPAEPVST